MSFSAAGIAFLASLEGAVLDKELAPGVKLHKPYNDAAGNATAGYGHLLHKGPLTDFEKHERHTEAQAKLWLQQDAQKAERVLRTVLRPEVLKLFNQPQWDALVSWSFNIGETATRSAFLIDVLNSPIFWEAHRRGRVWANLVIAAELGLWTQAGGKTLQGLVNRRAKEAKLWAEGVYGV